MKKENEKYYTIEEIGKMYEKDFPVSEGKEDFKFTKDNLVNDVLYVENCFPGGVSVLDDKGEIVLVEQKEHIESARVIGVDLYFNGFEVKGEWTIRYNRGVRGDAGKDSYMSTVTSDELLVYSLIFS